jgi:hypothetical protein
MNLPRSRQGEGVGRGVYQLYSEIRKIGDLENYN